jgi:putative serine protease PepD
MGEEPPKSVASTASSRSPRIRAGRVTGLVIGVALVAILGGIAGGLIVNATSGSGDTAGDLAGSTPAGDEAACRATQVADAALPSVTTVRASAGQQAGTGSGVIIRPGGYILTNDHVISVAANGGSVSVLYSDGETADAAIVGTDPFTDLAVLKASGPQPNLPPLAIGTSGSLQVGQPVVALGSPLGLTSTVTTGIVSALDRYVRVPAGNEHAAHLVGAIQTDASINPGNSGGALVDCAGRLIGINTAGATPPGSGSGSVGLGFAIPVDLAKPLADELISSGTVNHPSVGMQVQAIPRELAAQTGRRPGLFVQEVTAGGPADEAGIRPGDVIVEIDGQPATSVDDLVVKTLTMEVGETLEITYERAGTSTTTRLTLAAPS